MRLEEITRAVTYYLCANDVIKECQLPILQITPGTYWDNMPNVLKNNESCKTFTQKG